MSDHDQDLDEAVAGALGAPPDDMDDASLPDMDEGEFAPVAPEHEDIIAANALLDQNDTDNSTRFLNFYGKDLLYAREIGWHYWSGRFWDIEGGEDRARIYAQKTAKLMKREAEFIHPPRLVADLLARAETVAQKALDQRDEADHALLRDAEKAADALKRRREGRRKFAISCGNLNRTNAMIAQAIPHKAVAPAALDAGSMLFNVLNGTLVFSRREVEEEDLECPDVNEKRYIQRVEVALALKNHDPADMITKVAAAHYRPEAVSKRWAAFTERFVPDAEDRRFLQVAFGRALLGGALTQVLIFLYGDGANGKSVFMETIAQVLGTYTGRLKPESITGSMEQSGDKANPDFARLHRKRLVMIAELPRGMPLREGLVKTMTGSEPMPVRHLQKGFFDMVPEFIPFMSGNQMPEIGGLDKGIWRRMKFVHFRVTIDDAEQKSLPRVVAEHMEEADGILNWLIEGAKIFLAEGLKDSAGVRTLTQDHREDSDPIGAFVRDCVVPADGESVQARFMFNAFERYCTANAIRPWTEKTFSMAMKQKGFRREDKRIRVWLNVRLSNVSEADPQPAATDGPRY